MLKEYVFKVVKKQYIKVNAEDEDTAYELAEENSLMDGNDEEIIKMELIDVYDEDVDSSIDSYIEGHYDNDYYDNVNKIKDYFNNRKGGL